jgi:hypothetical protein
LERSGLVGDPITDLKQELLAAAARQHVQAADPAARRRWLGHLGRNQLLLTATTVAIAAVGALFFTTPWSKSPSFLARAEAAFAADAGTVLHAKWEETWTSTDPACTVTRGPNEIWIDQTVPYRYRAHMNEVGYPSDPRAMVCSNGTATEVGGTLDPAQTTRFEPPNTLSHSPPLLILDPDPVAKLREGISAGRAHDEGEAQLRGRTVERIRIDPPAHLPSGCAGAGCPHEPTYVYVDPDTFHPVELHGVGFIVLDSVTWFRVVRRELTFEYLPRTAANLALSDIQAQHPNAIGP